MEKKLLRFKPGQAKELSSWEMARPPKVAAPSRIQEAQLTPDELKAAGDMLMSALQSVAPANDVPAG